MKDKDTNPEMLTIPMPVYSWQLIVAALNQSALINANAARKTTNGKKAKMFRQFAQDAGPLAEAIAKVLPR